MAAKPKAATKKGKVKRIASEPATYNGGGVSLVGLAEFLPPTWKPYLYGATALLGIAGVVARQVKGPTKSAGA
jgi:hypothetical protein